MFEIKIRMMNEEVARKLLAPLGLGTPEAEETGVHIYLEDEETTRKIKDVNGTLTYVVAQRHGPGFTYTTEPISPQQRSDLETHYPPAVTLTIHRTVWNTGNVSIELNRIPDDGIFLELHGDDFECLKTVARQIGFSEQHYLTRSYDKLA